MSAPKHSAEDLKLHDLFSSVVEGIVYRYGSKQAIKILSRSAAVLREQERESGPHPASQPHPAGYTLPTSKPLDALVALLACVETDPRPMWANVIREAHAAVKDAGIDLSPLCDICRSRHGKEIMHACE